MKNIFERLSIFTALVLVLSIAACKSGDKKKEEEKKDTKQSKAEILFLN